MLENVFLGLENVEMDVALALGAAVAVAAMCVDKRGYRLTELIGTAQSRNDTDP
jgi:hypothetical protein